MNMSKSAMQPQGMQQQMQAQAMQPHMMQQGGHLYMQTNETRNCVIHYFRAPDGKLSEVERVFTRGAGSGLESPIYHIPRPNHNEGAGSVIVTADRRFLFVSNAGDNSVSSLRIGEDGRLTLVDVKRTGNTSGSGAKSLAYSSSTCTLFVAHTFGPDHIHLMSVDDEGNLTPRPENYTVNTKDWTNRCPTMIVLSPDGRFLISGTTFDELPTKKNPDGSLILWIPKNGGSHFIASNAPDPNGLVVFPVSGHGALGEPSFYDGGGASPFYIAFLHNQPNTFLIGTAVSDGVGMGHIDADGKITVSPAVPIDTSAGVPSELCWLQVSPDDRTAYSANFGYSYISSFNIDGNIVSVAKDPASAKIPGDGTFRALNGTVSSGPSDNWICPTGDYLYQIYGNASKLVAYATQPDGSLVEISSCDIPYNTPCGLAGF